MTLQQLRSACSVVDAGFNVTRAAMKLHTTQSAISKALRALENELGTTIFTRSTIRISGLTEYGEEFIRVAHSILRDAEFVANRAREDNRRTRGLLRIAAAHNHVAYSLPAVIRVFRANYPDIHIQVEQAEGDHVAQLVASRRVQIGIAGVAGATHTGLVKLPAMKIRRSIVVPRGHDLLSCPKPMIEDIARYPIVAHDELHPAGERLRALFRRHRVSPHIVVSAPDAAALKEYVAAGVGVAILLDIAIRPEDEGKLATIDASHLIPATDTHLIIRQGEHLRSYVYDFAQTFASQWSKRAILTEMEKQTVAERYRRDEDQPLAANDAW
jgi:DNA-binding transcriptional LysR family regulator